MDWPLSASALARWTRLSEQARTDKLSHQPLQGVIDVGKALRDQEQVTEQDLMFLEGDEVVVLQHLHGETYLGYCEGVIGTFEGSAVDFDRRKSDLERTRPMKPDVGLGIHAGTLEQQYTRHAVSTSTEPQSERESSSRLLDSLSHTSHGTPSLVASPSTDFDDSSVGHDSIQTRQKPFPAQPSPRETTTLTALDDVGLLKPRPIKISTGSSDGSVSSTLTPSSDDRTLSIIFDSYRYSVVSNAPLLRQLDGGDAQPAHELHASTKPDEHSPTAPPVRFGAASTLRSQLEAMASLPKQDQVSDVVTPEPESAQPVPKRYSTDVALPPDIPRLSAIFPKSDSINSLGSITVPVTPSPTTTMFPRNGPNVELEAARRLFSMHFKGPVSASSLPPSSVETLLQGSSSPSSPALPDAPVAKHRSLSARRKSVKGLTISAPIVTLSCPSPASRQEQLPVPVSKQGRVAFDLPQKPTAAGKTAKVSAIPLVKTPRPSLDLSESVHAIPDDGRSEDMADPSTPGLQGSTASSAPTCVGVSGGDLAEAVESGAPSTSRRDSGNPPVEHQSRRRPIRPISVVPPLDEDEVSDHRANESQWVKALSSKALSGEGIRSNKKLRALAMQGIPSSVRAKVWARLVETDNLVVPGLYQSLCEQETNGLDERIDRDVHEVSLDFPRIAGDASIKRELAAVVKAIVRMDREIRYSTALVFFAGVFLSQFAVGEPTFWTCIAVLTRLGYRRHFTRLRTDKDAIRISTLAFGFVLERASPTIASRFVSCQIDPSAFLGNWVSTMFVTVLPWSTCLRVVDLVLLDPLVFNFLTSLTILKLVNFEDEQVAPDRKTMTQLLKRPPVHLLGVKQFLPTLLAMSGASNGAVAEGVTRIKPTTIDKALKNAKTVIESIDAERDG
ncbi:hypothetical protein ACM66B_000187 [Microbotryomycetes sp. NB124-2]